jgi:iron complex outermembrane recepter protein
MKNTAYFFLFCQIIFSSNLIYAEQVLTLDVIDQNFNSTERIVIDQEAIKRSRATNLAQVLASQANIVITSNNLQPNSVFVRGGDSSHVLFVVDDVPTYDSSSPQKTINLGFLNINNVKRIEILKGSQSVLYGGQALSAVIKIYTLPDELKNSGQVVAGFTDKSGEVAVGFDRVIKNISSVDSMRDQVLVSINTKYKDAQNPSPAQNSYKFYPQKTVSTDAAAVWKFNEQTRAIIKLNHSNDINSVTTTAPGPPTTADFKAVDTNENFLIAESYGLNFILKKSDQFNFSLSHQKNRRQFFQEAYNSSTNDKTDRDYIGQLNHARFEVFTPKTESLSGTVGLTLASEKFEQIDLPTGFTASGSAQYEGAFGKMGLYLVPEKVLVELGLRREFTKLKNLADTYQLGLTLFKDLRIEYSNGFKAPSLFQLYAPGYGNSELKSEKAETVNLSYEKKMTDNWSSSVSLFDSNYKNLIIYLAGQYQNVATSRTTGVELATSYSDQELGLHYQLFLAYQEPYDASTSTWLVKRPLRSGGAKLTKIFDGDKASMTFELNHVGERRDKQTSAIYTDVGSYTLVNVSANAKVTENTEIFTRVNNLSNQTYQTSYGYYDTGVKGSFGVQLSF